MSDQSRPITPDLFASYLRSHGWLPVETWRGMYVWERGAPGGGKVLVPAEDTGGSAQMLMERALADLAAIEERSPDQLLSDLRAPGTDTQTFRLFPSTPTGTIPFPEGRRAIDAIYHLLRDAGRNRIEGHRLLYQDRASDVIYRFLDRVQLGLPEPGSYAFTTKTPGTAAADADSQETLFDLAESEDADPASDQEIVVRLHEAVGKAQALATRLLDRSGVDDPSEAGLSANFCKALGELGGSDHDRPFEIGFQWGDRRPEPWPDSSLRFSEPMTQAIFDFGVRLERLAKSGSAEVEGRVVGLFTEDSPHRRRAQIKGRITTSFDRHEGSLWVYLGEDDYAEAISAHRTRTDVRASGTLQVEHGGLRLHLGLNRLEVLSD